MKSEEKSLCNRAHMQKTSSYRRWAPKQLIAFSEFAKTTFSEGKLSNKDKELIAIGCAHSLRCPYCIDYHVDLAIKAKAKDEEIAEASWVGIFITAHCSHDFLSREIPFLDMKKRENQRPRSYEEKFQQLSEACLSEGVLTSSTKLLIAIGCAHSCQAIDSTKQFVESALQMSLEEEAIAEAIWVSIEMAAGASFGYSGLTAELLDENR